MKSHTLVFTILRNLFIFIFMLDPIFAVLLRVPYREAIIISEARGVFPLSLVPWKDGGDRFCVFDLSQIFDLERVMWKLHPCMPKRVICINWMALEIGNVDCGIRGLSKVKGGSLGFKCC